MTSFIAAGGSGRSTNVIPAVPAASSVTTIAFIRHLPLSSSRLCGESQHLVRRALRSITVLMDTWVVFRPVGRGVSGPGTRHPPVLVSQTHGISHAKDVPTTTLLAMPSKSAVYAIALRSEPWSFGDG